MHIVDDRPLLSSRNAKHLWPALGGLTYSINFSVQSEAAKVVISSGEYCGKLPDSILFAFGLCSVLFYFFLSYRLLKRNLAEKTLILMKESLQQLHSYIWVLHSSIILCVSFGVLLLVWPLTAEVHLIFLPFLSFLSIIHLLMVFVTKPSQLLYISVDNSNSHLSKILPIAKRKNEQLALVRDQLNKIMEEKKPFLNPNFDLTGLIKISKIPGYKISASIREQVSMTVPEYINTYRIKHAKHRLGDNASYLIKIDVLSHECGFSSRSNFYSAFKKHTGITPIEYRESKVQNRNK